MKVFPQQDAHKGAGQRKEDQCDDCARLLQAEIKQPNLHPGHRQRLGRASIFSKAGSKLGTLSEGRRLQMLPGVQGAAGPSKI